MQNSLSIYNLSNNSGISECPSIAISNNNIYVIWEDYTSGNHETSLQIFLYEYSLSVTIFPKNILSWYFSLIVLNLSFSYIINLLNIYKIVSFLKDIIIISQIIEHYYI